MFIKWISNNRLALSIVAIACITLCFIFASDLIKKIAVGPDHPAVVKTAPVK